jgi:periplasmic protein TonB
MYGAVREHAPQSTRLTGALTAATATLAFGYAMANGMGAYIVSALPDPITYVVLPEEPVVDMPLPTTPTLDTTSDIFPIPDPMSDPIDFTIEPTTIIGEIKDTPRGDIGPVTPLPPRPPAMIRTAPKLIPASSPIYPPADVRMNHQGTTSLEVCVSARGSVTSASLASSSGYASLDQAALKWVRDRKFTPAKLDNQPQAICGHPVIYEWKLNR